MARGRRSTPKVCAVDGGVNWCFCSGAFFVQHAIILRKMIAKTKIAHGSTFMN